MPPPCASTCEVLPFSIRIQNGKLITGMKQGANTLHFFYDAQSRPAMVDWNGVIYTYARNHQGDIIAFLDSGGAVVIEYYYDAWNRQYEVGGENESQYKVTQFSFVQA